MVAALPNIIEPIRLTNDIESVANIGISKIKDSTNRFDDFAVFANYLSNYFAVGCYIDSELLIFGNCFYFDGTVVRNNSLQDVF